MQADKAFELRIEQGPVFQEMPVLLLEQRHARLETRLQPQAGRAAHLVDQYVRYLQLADFF